MKKAIYFITCTKGLKGRKIDIIPVKGYTFPFKIGENIYKFGCTHEIDGWVISELSTGYRVASVPCKRDVMPYMYNNIDMFNTIANRVLNDNMLQKVKGLISSAYAEMNIEEGK